MGQIYWISKKNVKYTQHYPKWYNIVINEYSEWKKDKRFELIQSGEIFVFDNLEDAKKKAEEDL